MSERLRTRVVEAGARAMYESTVREIREMEYPIEDQFEIHAHAYRQRAGEVLDAMLDCLTETGPTHEWCKTHTSNGRGPSPYGEACHYAALQMVVHPEWAIEPCSWTPAHVIPADYLTEEDPR